MSTMSLWPPRRQAFGDHWEKDYPVPRPFPNEKDLTTLTDPRFLSGFSTFGLSWAGAKATSSLSLPSIRKFKSGGSSNIYELEFNASTIDGEKETVLGRLPKSEPPSKGRIASEVATLTLARHILGIPTPDIFAWNELYDGPVRTPYMLMSKADGPDGELVYLELRGNEDSRKLLLKKFAAFHAKLATPLPFSSFGSLYFSPEVKESLFDPTNPRHYCVGQPLPAPHEQRHRHDNSFVPFSSGSGNLVSCWRNLFYREKEAFLERWPLDTPSETEVGEHEYEPFTMGAALAASKSLEALLLEWAPPQEWPAHYFTPCLSMTDYAFRNFIVDPDTFEIRCVFDWDSYCVRPFLLCTLLPEDICSSGGAGRYSEWSDPLESGFVFLPPDEDPYAPMQEEDEFKQARVKDTHRRHVYLDFLKTIDKRFDDDLLWKAREDPLRIQDVVSHGVGTWVSMQKWIEMMLEKTRAAKKKT